jgi:ABC-2 type transport system ATP-binding protein
MKGMKEKDALAELKMWFEKFEIQEWWDKKVEDLSKGMAQKIQFITTVVHKPKLLILDEPFSGFDPINAELIHNEMLRLRDEGTTIVLSTHDMGSVESLCDNIALINRSHVILSGSVAEVRDSFRTKTYTLKFEGTLLEFTIALGARFELMSNELNNDVHTVTVRIKPEFKLNDLLKQVIPVVDILSAEEKVPSMHDIFIQSVLSFNEAQA